MFRLAVFVIIFGCASQQPKETISEELVVLNSERSEDNEIYKRELYKLKSDQFDCFNTVGVRTDKKTSHISIDIRQSYQHEKCTQKRNQLADIKVLLTSVLKKYDMQKLTYIFTSGYYALNPKWNRDMARFSSQYPEWVDYSMNYPKHKSKKSSNQMFVDLANTHNIHKEFTDIFIPFGIIVQLKGVEKVFVSKIKDFSFADELSDIKFKNSVMYDAGMFHWDIIR